MGRAGARIAVLGALAPFLAVFLVLAGDCGSSNPIGGGGGADNFVGTWTYATGSMLTATNCTVPIIGTQITSLPLDGQMLQITKIDDSHISVLLGSNCNVHFTVSGTTATADSGQMCNINYMGLTVTLNVTSWTLTSSGSTLTTMESGSAPIGGSMCTATGNGTLTGMGG
jgi:hypothetical protein